MEEFFAVLGNSHFEAYIGGPIAGVIAGILFSSSGGPGSPSGGKGPPGGPGNPNVQHHHHHHYHYQNHPACRGTAPPASDSSAAFLAAAAVLVILATFVFVAYVDHIAWIVYTVNATLAWFSFAATVITLGSRQLHRVSGFRLTTWPCIVSLTGFWLTNKARWAIDADVSAFARSLLNDQSFSVGGLIGRSVSFFKAVNADYFEWITHQMAVFLIVMVCCLLTAMQCVHYVASCKANSDYGPFWQWLSDRTRRFDSWSIVLLTGIFLLAAGLLSSGAYYHWKAHLMP